MNEDELKNQEGAPAVGAPADGAPVQPSKRDTFRGRVSKRYPDLNMDDEDAYYDQMGGMMDEYESYESNAKKLNDNMRKSPAMAEMLLASREQDDFDPVVWMVQQKGLDLEAAMDDPEYAEKIAQARKDYLARQAKTTELMEAMKANLPGTLEAQRTAMEEAGLGDQYDDAIAKIFQLADDITHGKWNPEIGVLLAKGAGYDNAVSDAKDAGIAEGLNTKVDDKLRKLDGKSEYVPGSQASPKPVEPKKESKNMFLA